MPNPEESEANLSPASVDTAPEAGLPPSALSAGRGEVGGQDAIRATWAVSWTLLAFAAASAVLAPSLVKITPEFNMTLGQQSLLSTFLFVPLLISVAAAGYLGRFRTMGFLTTAGVSVMGVACLFLGLSGSYAHIAAGVVLLGLGGGQVEVHASALVGSLFEGRARTQAMNYVHVAFAAGAIGVPLGIGALIQSGQDWRLGFWATGVASLLSAGWMIWSGTVKQGHSAVTQGNWREGLDRFSGILMVAMFCYVSAEVAVVFWFPTYFISVLGSSDAFAAVSNGVFWTGVVVGRLAAGYFGKYVRDVDVLKGSSMAGVAALVLFWFLQSPVSAIVAAGVAGLAFAAIWPTIVSYAAHVYGARMGYAYSWIIGFGAVGAAFGPGAVGAAAVRVGQHTAFLLIPVLLATITVCVFIAPGRERWASPLEERQDA